MTTYSQYSQGGNRHYPPLSGLNVNTSSNVKTAEVDRGRTPSPTPSELIELHKPGFFNWEEYRHLKFWVRREWLWYYFIGVIVVAVAIPVSIFHKQIVDGLTPVANWIHNLRYGWLIPVAIFFVISFPPLFGHEIVAILCGVVWGLWTGFGIVALGTFLGELGNFYAFKYCCRARGEKLEKTKITYACLAKVVRDGGFKVALIARLSVIPGHFTTAVFATCGMSVFTFSMAAILSLPKQFITVYLGVILEQSGDGTETTDDRIISDVVLAITALITILAMWYIIRKMKQVKKEVIRARRKARQGKLDRSAYPGPYRNSAALESGSAVALNPLNSETDAPDVPQKAVDGPSYSGHQQWDDQGYSIGYATSYPVQPRPSSTDKPLRAPQPRRSTPDGSLGDARSKARHAKGATIL